MSRLLFKAMAGLLLATIITLPLYGKESAEKAASHMNSTGMLLYYIMDRENNTVMSPLATSTSLLMTYMGARGETEKAMKAALHLQGSTQEISEEVHELIHILTNGNPRLDLASSLWLDIHTSVLPNYKETLKGVFGAEIEKANFLKAKSTATRMNDWVYEKSHGKISHFISPSMISKATRMVLLNTLFLKGQWESPFPTQATGIKPFKTRKGMIVNAAMMQQTDNFLYAEDEESQVIALPIKNNRALDFIIFFPKNSESDLFNAFYEQDDSNPEGLLSHISRLKMRRINLSLPKFAISDKLDVKPFMHALGIDIALTPNADFSGITGKSNLLISEMLQENQISIDESGIFAASAAAVSFNTKSSLDTQPPAIMNVNSPFLFAVIDRETQLILFLGECLNPNQGGGITE